MSNAGGFKSLTRYYDMLAGNTVWNPWEPQGAFDALATVTVPSGGAATVTIAGIPTGYKHLQLRYLAKNTTNAGYYVLLQMNSDSGANYSQHQLFGNGSSAGASGATSQTSIPLPRSTESGVADVFSAGIVDILDYANTTKNKTVRSIGGKETNTANTGFVDFNSGAWLNTSAVNSITLSFLAGSYAQNSSFALYGVK